MANHEIPELASFIIFISQACNNSLELELLEHLFNADNGEKVASLEVRDSNDFSSFLIDALTEVNLYKKIHIVIIK